MQEHREALAALRGENCASFRLARPAGMRFLTTSWSKRFFNAGRSLRAATTIQGVEHMHRVRKEQFDLCDLATQGRTMLEIWAAVLRA